MKFKCEIYLEAEDVAQTRILSTISFVKNLTANSKNPYIAALQINNESDMDDFILRLYLKADIEKAVDHPEDVTMLAPLLAEFLSDIAEAQSYLDMEGSFSVSFEDNIESYRFISEGGDSLCDFIKES